MSIKIVKALSVINLAFLMAVVSALDTETIGADVFTSCMLLSMALGIVLMHILEHLKRKERRRRENERQAKLYLRRSSGRRKGA
nr:MAG TPA: holin [Caudoviricetes sp.]